MRPFGEFKSPADKLDYPGVNVFAASPKSAADEVKSPHIAFSPGFGGVLLKFSQKSLH
jgi:hypothetical protein